jgi:galactokinase
MPPEHVRARAPGRVCILGEHTDYNDGLALAIAIEQGVTVEASRLEPAPDGVERVLAYAADLDEHDEFLLADPANSGDSRNPVDSRQTAEPGDPGEPGRVRGWRAFVRGMVAELRAAGNPPPVGMSLAIEGNLPRGAGLSSSAALEVALALAMLALAGHTEEIDKTALARLCSRVENDWAGARTGLLDQLSSLYGQVNEAMRIDFQTLAVESVPFELDGWRLVTADSGERRENASSGYNRRREECARACELLGVGSLRELESRPDGERAQVDGLPEQLHLRVLHVLGDNRRVREAVVALRGGDLPALAQLLNESHASLRDQMEISTPTVDAAVTRMLDAGAAGARLLGGGFGGSVLGLLPPGIAVPAQAREVRPCMGARVADSRYGLI